jgi:hypothetical protein
MYLLLNLDLPVLKEVIVVVEGGGGLQFETLLMHVEVHFHKALSLHFDLLRHILLLPIVVTAMGPE